jgi:hypothetical protein
MTRFVWLVAFLLTAFIAASGCKSTHEEGVKSNLRTQWTTVAADVEKTTEAAKDVLEDQGLRNVESTATNLDGKATSKMADDKKITVTVKRKKDAGSEVSVNVGTLGDPAIGAEIAKKIKMKAEGQ